MNKRYFTIDFKTEQFFYSHSPDACTQGTAAHKVSKPYSFHDLLSTYAVPALETRPSVLGAMGMSPGPSPEHGIFVQTRQKEFELYFSNSVDADCWLEVFERAIEIATQDATDIAPPE